MAIALNANFEYLARGFLDARQQFNTLVEMTDFAESSIPDGFITYNNETQKHYVFNSSNTIDATLGKWREYNNGGSSGVTYPTWNSNVDYTVGNIVLKDEIRYSCIADHTSTDFETDINNWIVILEQYYHVTQEQYNKMVSDGLITDATKDLYIVDGNSEGGNSSSASYTTLEALGLTVDATIDDVIGALKDGESFIGDTGLFTNYLTMFPNDDEQDQFAVVRIEKQSSTMVILEWFRKDGTAYAIGGIGDDGKFNGWKKVTNGDTVDLTEVNTKIAQLENNQIKKTNIYNNIVDGYYAKIEPGISSNYSKIIITDLYGGCLLITGALVTGYPSFKVVRLSNGSWNNHSPSDNTVNKIINVYFDGNFIYIQSGGYNSMSIEGGLNVEKVTELPSNVTQLPILDLTQGSTGTGGSVDIVTTIDGTCTNTQVPSAKAVYDKFNETTTGYNKYTSISELNNRKGTNIQLVPNEDNTLKIVEALDTGEEFADWYDNSSNRFGLGTNAGSIINYLRIQKTSTNNAMILAVTDYGKTFSRLYMNGTLGNWCTEKDFVKQDNPSDKDFNNYKTDGYYSIGLNDYANKPDANTGTLLVFSASSYKTQLYITNYGNMYFRNFNSSWSEWVNVNSGTGGGTGGVGDVVIDNASISMGRKSGTTIGNYSTASGFNVEASGNYSHAEGYSTTASGEASHAEGYKTTASESFSHAEGGETEASGAHSHAEGYKTTASGAHSHAEGFYARANGFASHAEGMNTEAIGQGSHAEGYYTNANGDYSHAEGQRTTASGIDSHAGGFYTIANDYQYTIGQFNVDTTGGVQNSIAGSAFVIGNGTANTTSDRSNAFRVTFTGATYGKGAYNTSGADYAEYFEWIDGNVDNEDRRGLFVTLDGDKIKLANDGDYILGVVSSNPVVLGNSDMEWQGRFLKDKFGSLRIEKQMIKDVDEQGNEIEKEVEWYITNPEYDPNLEYVERKDRQEWTPVGFMGQLVVIDDGTCVVNGYCKCGVNGVATKADNGYRVMKRIDENTILVLIK